VIHAV